MKYENKTTVTEKITQFGLYFFAISIPISFVPAEIAALTAFIGWFLEGILNKRWQLYKTRLYIPLLFYLAWNIFSSAISPRPVHSLSALLDNEWPMLIMLLMLSTIEDINVLKRMLNLWLFSASLSAAYGIWQTFSGIQFHRPGIMAPMGEYFRAIGFYGFFLTFAGFIMSVFFVSLCISFSPGIKKRWLYILAAVLSFIAVIGTFARSIWLSFAAAVPVFGFMKGKKTGFIATSGFIAVVLLCLIFIPSIRERAYSIIIPSENQTRLNLWKTSINISADFPLTGIGEDNFDYYFDKYKVEGYYDATGHPHNDYLNVLVNSGIPGLFAFVSIWIYILWIGFVTAKRAKDDFLKNAALGSTLAIIGFMVGGFFQNYYGTFANCWGWWFMAGITMSAHRMSRN